MFGGYRSLANGGGGSTATQQRQKEDNISVISRSGEVIEIEDGEMKLQMSKATSTTINEHVSYVMGC